MMRLAVNIDHVATVRQARRAREPEPVTAAALAELAGADGITVHLRGDRRHMQDRDLRMLRDVVSTRLNVEMAATDEMMNIASSLKPDQVTLVPEEPGEVTTTGGLDVSANQTAISAAVRRLQDAGIPASLFIDADPDQISLAGATGATAIEINTGPYADAPASRRAGEIVKIQQAARQARTDGLEVLGGHGLTYVNVGLVAAIPEIVELNIGHSIISRAVLVGLERAVREMIALVR
jgi:pyridoxine 5-phosphate synthase